MLYMIEVYATPDAEVQRTFWHSFSNGLVYLEREFDVHMITSKVHDRLEDDGSSFPTKAYLTEVKIEDQFGVNQ